MTIKDYKIVLCSGSPRRQELLSKAGIEFELRKREVDESYPESLAIDSIAEYLANKKADVQMFDIASKELILTADTIVAFENKEYGKPSSREESIRMLLLLSGQVHEVYTGVCLSTSSKRVSFTCKSVVKLSSISKEEAAWYYDNFDPSDKAGSYGIQDWLGYCKVEWINGSYTNILGLPLAQTLYKLNSFVKDQA